MRNTIFLFFTQLLIFIQINVCLSQAPYQVLIKLKPAIDSPNAIHLCNGVIVHGSVILTTADCMQVKIHGTVASHYLNPAMVMVYAGNPNGPANLQIIRSVKSIEVAPGFNSITLENDLAVLKLNESLPLGYRPDIQWIMIDNHGTVNQTCAASFSNIPVSYTQNSLITHPIIIEDQMVCYKFGNYTLQKRRSDICSAYVLRPGIMCNATSNILRYTVDRGTPLVCQNKVISLLSSIIAPTSSSSGYSISCNQLRLYSAYYTNLGSYLTWIYQKLAEENSLITKTNNNNISPPYVGPVSTPGPIPMPMPGPGPMPMPGPVPVPGPGPLPSHTTTHAPKRKKNSADKLKSGYIITIIIAVALALYL